jgi:hypothetical protein
VNLQNARCNNKDNHISNFMKIPSEGKELFRADRRTQMSKLMVGFRNSAKAPKVGLTDTACGLDSSGAARHPASAVMPHEAQNCSV